MGDLFGEEDRGHELMWSMGNGMMMHQDFEEAYDEHTFCLVPIEKPGARWLETRFDRREEVQESERCADMELLRWQRSGIPERPTPIS